MVELVTKPPHQKVLDHSQHIAPELSQTKTDFVSHERALVQVFGIEEEDDRTEKLIQALSNWAKSDGAGATTWAEEHLSKEEQTKILGDVLAVWAWRDPEGIRQWFREGYDIDEIRHRVHIDGYESMGTALAEWFAFRNPLLAADFVVNDLYQFKGSFTYSDIGDNLASVTSDADDCRRICEALLPYHEETGRHLNETMAVLDAWEKYDSGAKEAFLKRFPPKQSQNNSVPPENVTNQPIDYAALAEATLNEPRESSPLWRTMANWARESPDQAAAWIEKQGDRLNSSSAKRVVAARLAKTDPARAIGLLAGLPQEKQATFAISRVFEEWASESYEEALAYIDSRQGIWSPEEVQRMREFLVTAPRKIP